MLKESVEKALADIRPQLQADGGDIELVSLEKGVVKVRFRGECAGCPYREITLQQGIERYLKQKIPQVTKVIAV
jgi:Fe-S cluster biogenesis protein NfuA